VPLAGRFRPALSFRWRTLLALFGHAVATGCFCPGPPREIVHVAPLDPHTTEIVAASHAPSAEILILDVPRPGVHPEGRLHVGVLAGLDVEGALFLRAGGERRLLWVSTAEPIWVHAREPQPGRLSVEHPAHRFDILTRIDAGEAEEPRCSILELELIDGRVARSIRQERDLRNWDELFAQAPSDSRTRAFRALVIVPRAYPRDGALPACEGRSDGSATDVTYLSVAGGSKTHEVRRAILQ
jgi:hypothetical protein